MILELFCSNSARRSDFSEIQLPTDGRADTPSYREINSGQNRLRAHHRVGQSVGPSVAHFHMPTFIVLKNAKKVKWEAWNYGRTDRLTD